MVFKKCCTSEIVLCAGKGKLRSAFAAEPHIASNCHRKHRTRTSLTTESPSVGPSLEVPAVELSTSPHKSTSRSLSVLLPEAGISTHDSTLNTQLDCDVGADASAARCSPQCSVVITLERTVAEPYSRWKAVKCKCCNGRTLGTNCSREGSRECCTS